MSDEVIKVEGEEKPKGVVETLTASRKVETPMEMVRDAEAELMERQKRNIDERQRLRRLNYIQGLQDNPDNIPDPATKMAVMKLITSSGDSGDLDSLYEQTRGLVTASKVKDYIKKAENVGANNFSKVTLNKLKSLSLLDDKLTKSQLEQADGYFEYFDEEFFSVGQKRIKDSISQVLSEVDINSMNPVERIKYETNKKIQREYDSMISTLAVNRR